MSYQHFTSSYSDTEYENPQQETRSRQIVDNNAESEDKNSGKLYIMIAGMRTTLILGMHAGGLYGTIQAKLVTGQDIRPPVQERETAISNDKLSKNSTACMHAWYSPTVHNFTMTSNLHYRLGKCLVFCELLVALPYCYCCDIDNTRLF